jgi:hypothetical protein
MQGRKASSWRFQIGTNQLRETTLTENIGSPGSLGVRRGADTPILEKNNFVTKTEEATAGRWLEEAYEEGQGSHRAVGSIVMLMGIHKETIQKMNVEFLYILVVIVVF